MAFNHWSAASEARCYGGDRLLTNFCYPRERQRKCPCLFHPDLRDSVLDWRVVPRPLLGFDPPNFGIEVNIRGAAEHDGDTECLGSLKLR